MLCHVCVAFVCVYTCGKIDFSIDFFDNQAQFVARFRASFRPDSGAIPPDSTRFRIVFTLLPYLFYLAICRILQKKQPDSTARDNPFILLKRKMRRTGVNRRAIWRCTWILTSAYVLVAGTVLSQFRILTGALWLAKTSCFA